LDGEIEIETDAEMGVLGIRFGGRSLRFPGCHLVVPV
jgi:hypothetical protein